MPFAIAPLFQVGIAAAVLIGGYWLVDAIGDRREAKVHARYAKAAELTNKDIAAFNSDDEKVSAVRDAIRARAVEAAKGIQGAKYTKEQSAALSEIKWP